MRKGWIGIVVAGMLTACGGGGGGNGGGAQESGQLASTQARVAAKPMVGDYFTWQSVSREQGGTGEWNSYTTRVIRSVAGDGTASTDYLYDYIKSASPLTYFSSTTQVSFDKLGRWLGSSNGACAVTPNPPYYPVAPDTVTVGMSWQSSGTILSKCASEPVTQDMFGYKDSVFPLEQVTVPAGAFNAFKVVRSATEEYGNTIQRSERTCWWEPDLGIDVKCVTDYTTTDKTTGAIRMSTETESLFGYSKQKLGRNNDTELRFMGNWTGHLDGTVSGQNVSASCNLMVDGQNIDGSCSGAEVLFNLAGIVRPDGSLSFTVTNGAGYGITFTGKFDNIQQMSGEWIVPRYGSGSWILTQD
jgi:hypothetical protein